MVSSFVGIGYCCGKIKDGTDGDGILEGAWVETDEDGSCVAEGGYAAES